MASCSTISSDQTRSNTVCSSNSSCILQKRKPTHPLARNNFSTPSIRTPNGTVRQRVLSAKLHKLRTVQNQLNDVNFHLAELIKENKALKLLQKRQDRVLDKYEGRDAELPKLLNRHEEDIRILTEKNKLLRKNLRELNEQLKLKDEELIRIHKQLKHLIQLNKDKHLLEREKLTESLDEMKSKLEKAEEKIITLNRKIALDAKSYEQKMHAEMVKNKRTQKDLNAALAEIQRLTNGVDTEKTGLEPEKTGESEKNLDEMTEKFTKVLDTVKSSDVISGKYEEQLDAVKSDTDKLVCTLKGTEEFGMNLERNVDGNCSRHRSGRSGKVVGDLMVDRREKLRLLETLKAVDDEADPFDILDEIGLVGSRVISAKSGL